MKRSHRPTCATDSPRRPYRAVNPCRRPGATGCEHSGSEERETPVAASSGEAKSRPKRRTRQKRTDKRPRPFYQIHLSTMVVQTLLFGFLLLLQGEPVSRTTFDWRYGTVKEVELCGWPEIHSVKYKEPYGCEKHFSKALNRNMTCAFVILLVAFLLQESYLHRPKPLFTWGRTAGGLLLVSVLIYGAWCAQRDYRLHEFVCLNGSGIGREYCVSYDVLERRKAWPVLGAKCWLVAEDLPKAEEAVAARVPEGHPGFTMQVGGRKHFWLSREGREELGLR